MRALFPSLAILTISGPASAQLGPLTASVAVGWGVGKSLWSLDRQPIVAYLLPGPDDTVALARAIGAGPHVAATIAYRPGSNVALGVELFYLDTPVQATCHPVYVVSSGSAAWCAAKNGETLTNGSYGATAGIRLDVVSGQQVWPYLQAGLGVVGYGVSTVAMDGIPGIHPAVILDPNHHRSAATGLLAAGLARRFGASREIQLELRDMMIDFDRVTAPADSTGAAPTGRHMVHDVVLSLGVRMDLRAVTHTGR